MARTPEPGSAPASADLQRILSPARDFWYAHDPSQRRRWLYAGGAVLLVVAVATYLVTRNPMTLIYRNLSATAAGQVTQELTTLKIPYELQGTSVYVPSTTADQARVDLAMQGLPQQGTVGYSGVLQNLGIGMTDQQFSLAVLNALEQDLATTIDSISGVRKSVVNIVMPQPSVFVSQSSQQASAAVFVDLAPGATLSGRQVLGIEELVAHSVQGLKPSGVSVVDQNGNPLSAATAAAGSDPVSGQIGLQRSFEQQLNRQLTALLEPIVGPGNVVVQTNATLDLTQTSQQSTIVQPLPSGQGVPVSSHTIKETYSGSGTPPTVAGTSGSSVPTYTTGSTSGGQSRMTYTDSTINYDVTKINQTVTSQPFTLKGLTVSVMLNSRNYRLTATNRKALGQLIATAVGYSNSGAASSNITIFTTPFAKLPVPSFPANAGPPKWEVYAGAGAAAALLLGFVLLGRRRRPRGRVQSQRLAPPPPPAREPALPDPRREVVDRVRGMVGQDPEDAAQLVRGWIYEDAKERARRRP